MTDNENEFYDIPKFNGYKINKKGDVFNDITKQFLKQSLLNGYNYVKLFGKGISAHRLVALTFLPKPDGKT